MSEKDAYIKHLEDTIQDLRNQVKNLTEIVMLLRKGKFGSSSEKTPSDALSGQLSLFDDTTRVPDSPAPVSQTQKVQGYTRTNSKKKREEIIKDLPVQEILCDISEDKKHCGQCGTPLKPIGKEFVREELEYLPPRLFIRRYFRQTYECPKCKHTDKRNIVKADVPASLLNHSLASPGCVAQVLYQKYVNAIPLYRQEKDWEQLGVSLTRGTMANWIIRCAESYLRPVTDRLHTMLEERDIVHCDETPVQVLKEDGKKPQSKSYMWLYRTGNDGKAPIILYDYQSSRSGNNAAAFLKDFKGFVHSDGYPGYNKLTNVVRCGCWAHLRRKFVEAVPAGKAADMPVTPAETGRDYCNRLFEIEETLKTLSPQDRYQKRLELEKPILDAFWCWLENVRVLKGSLLGKAVTYAAKQKDFMENYLLDGRLALSNNLAENAIRPFTVGRKNWLFSDTPKGAKASAVIYSLVETAKANGLNVFEYLKYLLQSVAQSDWQSKPEVLDDFMPWNPVVQKTCSR